MKRSMGWLAIYRLGQYANLTSAASADRTLLEGWKRFESASGS